MSAHNQLFTPALIEIKRMIDAGDLGQIYWISSQDAFLAPKEAFKDKWRASLKTQWRRRVDRHRLSRDLPPALPGWRRHRGRSRHDGAIRDADRGRGHRVRPGPLRQRHHRPDASPHGQCSGPTARTISTSSAKRARSSAPAASSTICSTNYTVPAERNLPEVDTFVAQISRFADCIRDGVKPPHGPEEGRQVLRIILEASKNADGWQASS